jgi:hypothetical protein
LKRIFISIAFIFLVFSLVFPNLEVKAEVVEDYTFRWNAFQSITGGTYILSPTFEVYTPYRDITLQYLELHARVVNQGPGAIAWDQWVLLGSRIRSGIIISGVMQGVAFGWVDQGYSGDVWFSIDFLTQTYRFGGAPLLSAQHVEYYQNRFNVLPEDGETFELVIEMLSAAASNAYLRVEETWVRVKFLASGTPVPEFQNTMMTVALVALIGLFASRIIKNSVRKTQRIQMSLSIAKY